VRGIHTKNEQGYSDDQCNSPDDSLHVHVLLLRLKTAWASIFDAQRLTTVCFELEEPVGFYPPGPHILPDLRRGDPPPQVVLPGWFSGVSVPPFHSRNQGEQEDHQEYKEQHLRDGRGPGGNTAESKYGRDDRNDEEYHGPVQHSRHSFSQGV
jgi:hypothetical protein